MQSKVCTCTHVLMHSSVYTNIFSSPYVSLWVHSGNGYYA